jgi:hypothetical protein
LKPSTLVPWHNWLTSSHLMDTHDRHSPIGHPNATQFSSSLAG